MVVRFIFLLGGIILSACQSPDMSNLEYSRVHFTELPGWEEDRTLEALPAIERSCQVILKLDPNTTYKTRSDGNKGYALDWHPFCNAVKSYCVSSKKNIETEWRSLLINHLTPFKLSLNGITNGKFTGYYEPLLRGSKIRHGPYQIPLYKLPQEGTLDINIPRKEIVEGKLGGKNLELVWVDDPIDAFFLQIQGSGRVWLDDGKMLRLGYAGTNKHPYFPIGKTLVQKGELELEQASMQGIRSWLETHPKEADAIMNENQSFVFFRILDEENPIGSQGVPLTPTRSMAIDPKFISLGTPMWVNLAHPDKDQGFLRHMMIAQDTGGAIKGGLRGDYFWGFGGQSAEYAGKMNSDGEYYVLLPKTQDPQSR